MEVMITLISLQDDKTTTRKTTKQQQKGVVCDMMCMGKYGEFKKGKKRKKKCDDRIKNIPSCFMSARGRMTQALTMMIK